MKLLLAFAVVCIHGMQAYSITSEGKWVEQEINYRADTGIVIGDSVPNWFWDVKLDLVHDPGGIGSFNPKRYRDKLIVLDFWGAYCAPCIKSLDKWDTLQKLFPDDVAVVGIHLYYPNRLARPFSEKRGWQLPIAMGNKEDTLLNQLFYAQSRFGQVWIKDGKLLAIPQNKAVTKELVEAVISGETIHIPMEYPMTYFEHLDPMRNPGER